MRRYLAYASKWRRPVAAAGWGLLLVALVAGEIRFLPTLLVLVVFGTAFSIESFFYIFLAMLVAGAWIVYSTFRMGRVFCCCLCPYHQLLEWLRPRRFRAVRGLGAILVCFLLAWSLGYFTGKEPFRSIPSTGAVLFALTVFAILMIILFGMRERFCRRVCPYGVLQVLLRHDSTLRVIFLTPGCTNCGQCDVACPMRLNVRKESSGTLCTNCTRCIESCRKELGSGREVLRLWPRSSDES